MISCVLMSTLSYGQTQVLDSFENTSGWTLIAADGVKGEIVESDDALRLDYDFSAGSGYCVAALEVDLPLDPNYRFGYKFRGSGLPNTIEFKIIDEAGENVWWSVERDMEFPTEWTQMSMRRRHLSFAWGPDHNVPLSRVGRIEIAVTASQGGKGSVWIDNLTYERLPAIEPKPIEPKIMSGGRSPLSHVAADGSVKWKGKQGEELNLEFVDLVEFSGIELVWEEDGVPQEYRVLTSVDGHDYVELATALNSDGGRDRLFTPESEARFVRVQVVDRRAALDRIVFAPVETYQDANQYFTQLARDAIRGAYPLYFEELLAWTVVGLPDHDNEALVSATGAIEPRKSGYSLEPFVVVEDEVFTWADAEIDQTLAEGSLPIPSVQWVLDGLEMEITAVATHDDDGERVHARYQLKNTGDSKKEVTLALAARPFQVLPAAQFLNTIGGVSQAGSVIASPKQILVDDQVFAVSDRKADAVVAADASSATIIGRIVERVFHSNERAQANNAYPSGALLYHLFLDPGESHFVDVALPMSARREVPHALDGFDIVQERERERWVSILNRTDFILPSQAQELEDTIRANLAYILINADGEGIRPGSRSYERSWIRDGAMTSAALIALDHQKEARRFIDWYSAYQYDNGKIPCVVDFRGPDPVDENDAPGEFLFAIRNSSIINGEFDEAFARRLYPNVRMTIEYIEAMRNSRLTDEYTQSHDPILRACAGLMPESISHEGYSEKPMHSYWDDFWIYRGLWDAVELAELLGEVDDHIWFESLAQAFGESLAQSVQHASAHHEIDYVPGCVELGDFDATSTAIAYYPTQAAEVLDHKLLQSTFERAWDATEHRINGGVWDGMTPYEVRTVGTFIRLGWVDRAHEYMDWLLSLRDPIGWAQWGEIAYRDRAPARFVGDMPHTWVGSGAILSIISMLAYVEGDTLVLGSGIPMEWLNEPGPIGVRGLVTRFGKLSYTLQLSDGSLLLTIEKGPMPTDGYRVDFARLMGHDDITIEADGKVIQPNREGVVVLPSSTSRVLVR